MTTLTSTDPRVVSFFNHYHERKSTFPDMYVNTQDNQTVNVVLPVSLADFANAAAGRFAIGSDGIIRPKGIRVKVSNAKDFVDSIFSSTDKLAQFLNSSEKDAVQVFCGGVCISSTKKVKPSVKTDNRSARDAFFEKYTANDAKALQAKFGRELVIREFDILSINEFELRFGLI